MLWSSDTCQNKVSTDDVIVGSSLELIKVKCFLKLTADQVVVWIELRALYSLPPSSLERQ